MPAASFDDVRLNVGSDLRRDEIINVLQTAFRDLFFGSDLGLHTRGVKLGELLGMGGASSGDSASGSHHTLAQRSALVREGFSEKARVLLLMLPLLLLLLLPTLLLRQRRLLHTLPILAPAAPHSMKSLGMRLKRRKIGDS